MATTLRITWDQFKAIPNGTPVFNHGYSECVALFNLFHEGVIGLPFVPVQSAYQLWTNFSSYQQLYPYYSKSSSPVVGSVFVSRGGPYNSLDGHVGLVTAVYSNGTFDTMEQNAAHRYVWRYNRGMSGVYGFLHPHNNPAKPETPAKKAKSILKRKRSKEQNDLIFIYLTQGTTTTYAILRPGSKGSWWQFVGQKAADAFASQLGNAAPVDLGAWEDLKKRSS